MYRLSWKDAQKPQNNSQGYTRLHRPAFKWIAKELGEEADKGEFKTILKCYRDFCGDGVALKAILDEFDPTWAKSAKGVMQLIKGASVTDTH